MAAILNSIIGPAWTANYTREFMVGYVIDKRRKYDSVKYLTTGKKTMQSSNSSELYQV
jgi:hypothetical protein